MTAIPGQKPNVAVSLQEIRLDDLTDSLTQSLLRIWKRHLISGGRFNEAI